MTSDQRAQLAAKLDLIGNAGSFITQVKGSVLPAPDDPRLRTSSNSCRPNCKTVSNCTACTRPTCRTGR